MLLLQHTLYTYCDIIIIADTVGKDYDIYV